MDPIIQLTVMVVVVIVIAVACAIACSALGQPVWLGILFGAFGVVAAAALAAGDKVALEVAKAAFRQRNDASSSPAATKTVRCASCHASIIADRSVLSSGVCPKCAGIAI